MHRLSLHYTLSRNAGRAEVSNPLIDLLQAVNRQGSISGAARALNLSYRHVWGELKRWESALGHELLVWEKGQRAQLSDFAAKLLWAERLAQARLAPQIDALRAELERCYALAFDPQVHVLTLYASHDPALLQLREYAAHDAARSEFDTLLPALDATTSGTSSAYSESAGGRNDPHDNLHLDLQFMGSVDAIRALNEGRCTLAGFHTLAQVGRGGPSERAYKRLLQPGLHKIIGFGQRTQGLIVARGNPMRLLSLSDVVQRQARFALRSVGSGTRVVLDELLHSHGLHTERLCSAQVPEPSHQSVAQAVASGVCDCGLGLAAPALQAGLDFVPLVLERYHLVCLKSTLNSAPMRHLLALLQSPAWHAQLNQIAGYQSADCGRVLSMRQVLPWWSYRNPKP
ncbi:MAG: substrate-binding domain-containing protein [Rhodoferax sp.]